MKIYLVEKQNGHHETVSEQEGTDPLYLYEGFRF